MIRHVKANRALKPKLSPHFSGIFMSFYHRWLGGDRKQRLARLEAGTLSLMFGFGTTKLWGHTGSRHMMSSRGDTWGAEHRAQRQSVVQVYVTLCGRGRESPL